MVARIFKPARSAMQSGEAASKDWLLEHEPQESRGIDPLTGWTSSAETRSQVRLSFDTKEQAIAYAERNRLAYVVVEPKPRKPLAKSYADNFRSDRKVPWTH
jgi:hypothetical protein